MLCRNKISAARVSRFPGRARAIRGALPAKILGIHAFEAKSEDARLAATLGRSPPALLLAQHRKESAETLRWTGEDGESIRTRCGVQYAMCRFGCGEIRQRYRQHKRGEYNVYVLLLLMLRSFPAFLLRISCWLLLMGSYGKCVFTPLLSGASGSRML